MAKYTENRLFDIHDTYGCTKFGRKRWNMANKGWVWSERSISSKIYPITNKQHTQILTTTWEIGEPQPHHAIEDY